MKTNHFSFIFYVFLIISQITGASAMGLEKSDGIVVAMAAQSGVIMAAQPGLIIVVNGTTTSGKSTVTPEMVEHFWTNFGVAFEILSLDKYREIVDKEWAQEPISEDDVCPATPPSAKAFIKTRNLNGGKGWELESDSEAPDSEIDECFSSDSTSYEELNSGFFGDEIYEEYNRYLEHRKRADQTIEQDQDSQQKFFIFVKWVANKGYNIIVDTVIASDEVDAEMTDFLGDDTKTLLLCCPIDEYIGRLKARAAKGESEKRATYDVLTGIASVFKHEPSRSPETVIEYQTQQMEKLFLAAEEELGTDGKRMTHSLRKELKSITTSTEKDESGYLKPLRPHDIVIVNSGSPQEVAQEAVRCLSPLLKISPTTKISPTDAAAAAAPSGFFPPLKFDDFKK